jgi:hypothetical protein
MFLVLALVANIVALVFIVLWARRGFLIWSLKTSVAVYRHEADAERKAGALLREELEEVRGRSKQLKSSLVDVYEKYEKLLRKEKDRVQEWVRSCPVLDDMPEWYPDVYKDIECFFREQGLEFFGKRLDPLRERFSQDGLAHASEDGPQTVLYRDGEPAPSSK